MTRALYNAMLAEAAEDLRHRLGLAPDETVETAIVLGTGWGDVFTFEATQTANITELAAFQRLDPMTTHKRRYEIGTLRINGKPKLIIALRGRVHMNESTFDPGIRLLVRLQIDVLIKLGVKKLLLTTAVGSLDDEEVPVRGVVAFSEFPAYGQDIMPNFPGEFVSIPSALNRRMLDVLPFSQAPHVFWVGSHFEELKDKLEMRRIGGRVVRMSTKPEVFTVAVARIHGDHPDVSVVALGYVSNGRDETMNDDEHRRRAQEDAPKLVEAIITTLDLWTD